MSIVHRVLDALFGPPKKIKRAVETNSEALKKLQTAIEKECPMPGAMDTVLESFPQARKIKRGI